MGSRNSLRVLIAGGGVAGLEAALALRRHGGGRVSVEVLSPVDRFVYKPMLVAAPFGSGGATSIDMRRFLDAAGASYRRGSLVAVEAAERTAVTSDGECLRYDALLVALGARPAEAIPGALTFADGEDTDELGDLLYALGRARARRIGFVVPPAATWAIAAYELALLTAAERDERGIRGVEISLVSHERQPLELFGAEAARVVGAILARAGIERRLGARALQFDGGALRVEGGEPIPLDRAVALPRLVAPEIRGLPRDEGGFLPTDDRMAVAGVDGVWAAGDATAFPLKQGGVAAQQAEQAALAIAAQAGADVEVPPFRPVLRAALITGEEPEVLEATLGGPGAGVATPAAPAPQAKLAATFLGPLLAEGAAQAEPRPVRALLAAADADARVGDFEGALSWLAIVERLDFVIPTGYVARREEWRRNVDPGRRADPAADRLEGRFATAAEALSDLERRVGWLREAEARTGGEMRAGLEGLDQDLERLKALSRRTGIL